MSAWPRSPDGFELLVHGREAVYARADLVGALRDIGLHRAAGWEAVVAAGEHGRGRGRMARLRIRDGGRVLVKKMRRGGLAGPLWRDRYPGLPRLLANLTVPLEASRRGIATAAPVSLCARRGALRLFEAWLAVEEISGARDLQSLLREASPSRRALTAVASLIRRMHDAGLDHPDLNLGNLLVREEARGSWSAFVVDLDRATFRPGPLPFGPRLRALRRVARSYVKQFGASGPLGKTPGTVFEDLYAAADAALARRIASHRRVGRLRLAVHKLGWLRRR